MSAYPFTTIPLLRAFIPFLIGILLVLFTPIAPPPYVAITGIICLALLALADTYYSRKFTLSGFQGFAIAIAFVLIGIIRVEQVRERDHPQHFAHAAEEDAQVLVKVRKPPKPADKTLKVQGEALKLWQDSAMTRTHGRLLVYLSKDSMARQIKYGDVLLCRNEFEPLEPPANPKQFDRKAFLANKQIHHQAFLDTGDWQLTELNRGNYCFQKIYQTRQQLLAWLRASITDEDAFAVAAALLAGYKAEIDPDLRSSYASTGAMHVLAVSGLHVGIIYLMLSYALIVLDPLPRGRLIKLGLIVLLLWLYACITGLPASVIRACTMFSFVAIGTSLQRSSHIYSSITASLLLLLLVNPFLITQVGFQLSYAAVIGIVFLQPRLYNLFPQSRYWLVDKIWAITAVSIAAQVSTFPLTIFYFNQFPTYFMISNLVVIPAAMVIVPTGFGFFALKGIGVSSVSHYAGTALDMLLQSLNYAISQVEALPYALIDQLYISTASFYLIYAFIIGIAAGLALQKKALLFSGLMAAAGFLGLSTYRSWQQQDLQKLAYLKIDNRTVPAGIGPDRAILRGPRQVLENGKQVKFFTYRFLWSNGLDTSELLMQPTPSATPDTGEQVYDTLSQNQLFRIQGKTVLAANRPLNWPDSSSCQLSVDHVLLTHDAAMEPSHFQKHLQADLVLLGYELAPWTVKEWEHHSKQAGFQCYNLRQDGAFVKNL